jgi:hypothetical protein
VTQIRPDVTQIRPDPNYKPKAGDVAILLCPEAPVAHVPYFLDWEVYFDTYDQLRLGAEAAVTPANPAFIRWVRPAAPVKVLAVVTEMDSFRTLEQQEAEKYPDQDHRSRLKWAMRLRPYLKFELLDRENPYIPFSESMGYVPLEFVTRPLPVGR